jgi:hypothetical protein
MAHMAYDLNWEPCSEDVWVIGVIVPGEAGDAEIRDDQGIVRSLVWGRTARRLWTGAADTGLAVAG